VCGPKWEMLVALKDQFADRVMLVVDAAQGRFRRRELRQWLADDAVVIVTGSKFFGAPSFCGAVLIPPRWRPVGSFLSAALSGYCSQADFPPHYEAAALEHQGNPGLLLRWACALAEMEAFYAIAAERRSAVTQCFHEEATLALTQSSSTRVVVRGEQPAGWPARTVVSFEVLDRGRPMSDAVLHRIRASLAKDEPGVLLGQPSAGTLRVALGAPLVVDLSQRADSAELLRAWFSSLTQRIEEFVERERV